MTNPAPQPWTTFPRLAGYTAQTDTEFSKWDAANWPYVVTWAVSYPDRLTRWISHTRQFQTLEAALAAYKMPFKGIDCSLSMYNGGKPGSHMTRLVMRKCAKSHKFFRDDIKALLNGEG